jgi:IMP dehydrogenase
MKVKDLLETKGKNVIAIDASGSVEDAIRLMNSNKISAIMVTEDGKTSGIFTERDVVRCYIASGGKSFREIILKDAITRNLVVAELKDDLNDTMAVMVEKNIRHLPVIDGGGVIGMLSVRDIILAQVGKITAEIHYLRDYIAGP